MALDATVGGVAANSYVTLAVALTYFGTRSGAEAWADADDTAQESALTTACVRLEAEDYRGQKVASTQRLSFPRYFVYDRDGYTYATTAIPLPVQQAQMELAFAILKEPTLNDDTGLEGFENVKLGSLDVTPRSRRAGNLPALVKRLLQPLLFSGYGTPVARG